MDENSEWEVIKSRWGWIIVPKHEHRCAEIIDGKPCNAPLLLHDFRAYYASQYGFYHADIHMKCPRCGRDNLYGVVISKEEYDKLRTSPMHGKVFTKEILDYIKDMHINISEEDEKIIRDRLEKLGYWGR